MKTFSLPLEPDFQRPLTEAYEMPALIDTGAIVPVFTLYPSNLKRLFDTELVATNKQFGGFDGNVNGSVYRIKNFVLGELLFEILEVFVPDKPRLRFPFLFSATMFYGMAYEIDTINNLFTIKVSDTQHLRRKFEILSLKGKLYPQVDGVLLQNWDTELIDPAFFIL